MTNLSNIHRDEIRRRAIADKYNPLTKALEERENALALEVREHLYGPHLKAAEEFDANHPDWLRKASGLLLNVGWVTDLIFAERQLLPQEEIRYGTRYITLHDEILREKVRALANDKKDLNTQRNIDDNKVGRMLDGFKSTRQLREGWPEGKAYWEPVIGLDDKKVLPPAIPTAAVNAALGLPKENAE